MRRVLFFVASCVVVAGCSNRTDGALRVVVAVDPPLKADCFEVSFSKGSTVLAYEEVKRAAATGTYTLGVKQGSMPAAVTIQAKAYLGDCTDVVNRKFNGLSTPVDHSFPNMGVEQVDLHLPPPDASLDADRDGYVSSAFGGSDCNDADATIHPGSTQACGIPVDTNCDGKFGCADPDCQSEPSCTSPGTQLAFKPSTASLQRTGCSQDVVLEVRDANGQVTPVPLDTTVTFTTSDPKVTVLGGGCSAGQKTSVTIPYNQSSAHLSVRSSAAGIQSVTAKATGLASGTLTVNVTPIPTSALVFTSAPQTVKAGDCSAPVTVELRDSSNTPTTAALDTALGISTTATGNFDFFAASDTTCATPLSAPATITVAAGQGGGSFRVRSTRAALPNSTFTLGVHDAAGSTPDSQVLTVKPGDPTALVFTSAQPGLQQTACSSSAVRVELQDAQGNTTVGAGPIGVTMDTVETVTLPSYFTFFTYAGSTVACTTAVSSTTPVTLNTGASSLSFAIKALGVGTYTMRARATGLTTGTQTALISAGAPNHIVVTTAPQTITAGACSGAVTVQGQDNSNTPSGPTADVQITVAATNGVVAYSDSSCTTPLAGGKVTLAAGTTTSTVYFGGTTSGSSTLTFTSSFPTVTQTETVNAGPPSKLAWATPAPAAVAAGACSTAFTLLVQDQFSNATSFSANQTLTVTSAAGPTFSSASGCGGPSTTFTLSSGAQSFALHASHTLVGSYPFTVSIGAMTSPSATLAVTPAAASKLVYTTAPPGTVVAGGCSPLVVERRDPYNNVVPVTAATSDALSTSGITGTGNGGAPQFFSSLANCNAGTPVITSISMAANSATASYYVRGRTIGTANLLATESASVSVTAPMIVTEAPGSKLALTISPTSLTVGVCSTSAQVQRQDPFDNPAPDGTAVTVNLAATGSASGTLKFFTSSTCAMGQTTTLSLASGATSVPFGVSGSTTGSVAVTASAPAASPVLTASPPFTVQLNPAAPSLVYATLPPTSATAGTCSQVTVERRDGLGNLVPETSASSITVTSSGITGLAPQFFSSSASCSSVTSPQTTLVVAMAVNASSMSFWVRGRGAGTATITATETGVPIATASMVVTPAATASLVLTISPTTLTAGVCSTSATVARQDQFANPTTDNNTALPVTLTTTAGSAASGVRYFTDTGCTQGSATTWTQGIGASSTSAAFSVNGTLVPAAGATATVTANGGGFTASTVLTFNPGTVSKIAFTTPVTPPIPQVASTVCSSVITVQSQDFWGNPSNPTGSSLAVALSSNAAGALTYSGSSSCTGGAITSVSIPTTGNTATFYFKDPLAEAVRLTATTTSPASAPTQDWSVTPGPASKLAFKAGTQPTSGTAFACGATPLTVQVQDAQGNLTTFAGSRTFQFTYSQPTTGLSFSTAAGCATVLSPPPAQNVYASPGEFTVYLLPMGTGTTTVTVSDVSGTAPLTATPASGSIVIGGTPGTLTATATSTLVEYGGCQPVVVQRFNGATAWTVGTTNVSLSGGSGDLSIHTNATCSTPGYPSTSATANIADGSSTVTFYVKGHSGPQSATALTLTASDTAGAFTSGTLGVTPLPLVRRGACTLTTGTSTASCTVAPAIPANDIARTFLVFQARAPGSAPSDQAVECHLTSGVGSVTVDCLRFGTTGDVAIQWQTASWASSFANGGVTVTHRILTNSTLTGTGVVDTTGVTVNLANTFLLFSEAMSDTAYNMADTTDGFLSSPTTATFNSGGAGFPASIQLSYDVVQMANTAVDRGQPTAPGTIGGSNPTVTTTTSRTVGTTAMLHSVRFNTGPDTVDVCRKRYRGLPKGGSATTDMQFFRGDVTNGVCTSVDPSELAWERVQFPTGTLVQWTQVNVNGGATASADSSTLSTVVSPHRSLLFMSGQGPGGQNAGETNIGGSDLGFSQGTVDFKAASCGASTCSILTVTRGSTSLGTGDNASFEPFVVQFSP